MMNELKLCEVDSYRLSLLSFINCLITAAPSVEERIQTRNEFIGECNSGGNYFWKCLIVLLLFT